MDENHRMAWAEKDHNTHLVSNPCYVQVTNQQTRLPRATSSLALNASRDGASTASLGNLRAVVRQQRIPPMRYLCIHAGDRMALSLANK